MLKIIRSRKEAKLQLLQDPSEINGDNLNNVRCEGRNKMSEYLKDKIKELATNSKNNIETCIEE
jgi:hypothetical protein